MLGAWLPTLLVSPIACEAELGFNQEYELNSACPLGEEQCGDACVDVQSDALHCGTCGVSCAAGQACDGGQCVCHADLSACGTSCVDTNSSGLHCGACNNSCAPGLKCSLGQCSDTCAPGLAECGADCVDTTSNVFHCGECNAGCGTGLSCDGGACSCPPGQLLCGGTCVDPNTSGSHCGACFSSCQTQEACQAGQCFCPPGSVCESQGTGGSFSGSGGAGSGECVDNPPPFDPTWPDATCEAWATETSECGAEWFANYCDVSCGRCTPTNTGGAGSGGSGSGGASSGGAGSGGAPGSGGGTGQGNPWGQVNGNQTGWASRYWDCCKQSCGWSGKGGNSPINSCNSTGDNAVSAETASACDGGGSSTTCNSFAPWAYSDEVSFGFVATHSGSGVTCGTCYHIQFTGSSHNGGADPGSQALNGKTMIVMATNIGNDVSSDGQLDLLIPGGGVGANYGCDVAWGVSQGHGDLGAQYGGLRSGCSGDLNAIKTCVANKCQKLFESRGLDEMYDACMWYVDWFQAADNPNFRVETISCPSELTNVAK